MKIIKFIKSKIIFILLGLLATVFGFLFFQAKFNPPKEELAPLEKPQIKQEAVSCLVSVEDLKKSFSSFPKEIEVYKVEKSSLSPSQALSIASNLGFQKPPIISQDKTIGQIQTWSSQEKILTIELSQGHLNYGLDLLNFGYLLEGSLDPLESVKKAADDFVNSGTVPLSKSFALSEKQALYIKKQGPNFIKSEKDEAQAVEINYQFKINQIEVQRESPQNPALRLILGPKNRIIKLDYFLAPQNPRLVGKYPLKQEDEVLQELVSRPKISLLQIEEKPMTTPLDLENIAAIRYEKAELVYLQKPESSYLQPVFFLTASAQLKNNQKAKAYLYLPAVAEKYLKTNPEL